MFLSSAPHTQERCHIAGSFFLLPLPTDKNPPRVRRGGFLQCQPPAVPQQPSPPLAHDSVVWSASRNSSCKHPARLGRAGTGLCTPAAALCRQLWGVSPHTSPFGREFAGSAARQVSAPARRMWWLRVWGRAGPPLFVRRDFLLKYGKLSGCCPPDLELPLPGLVPGTREGAAAKASHQPPPSSFQPPPPRSTPALQPK